MVSQAITKAKNNVFPRRSQSFPFLKIVAQGKDVRAFRYAILRSRDKMRPAMTIEICILEKETITRIASISRPCTFEGEEVPLMPNVNIQLAPHQDLAIQVCPNVNWFVTGDAVYR